MRYLAAANSHPLLHYLAGQCPGKLGWLMSAANPYREPFEWLPYAIDNGVYAAWASNTPWTEEPFFALLDRCLLCKAKPQWIVVPDCMANKEKTLWLWQQYEFKLRRTYKRPLAFVAQDGMVPADVPKSADVVFIGGTTSWKWRNVALFAAALPRVHVGRVNTGDKLHYCASLGIESCDGSGFFREGCGARVTALVDFVTGRTNQAKQLALF